MTFQNFRLAKYNDVVIPAPTLIGSMGPGFIWHEGLASWELVGISREIPLNKEIYLAPLWMNESEINIIGHVDLLVTYPDSTERTLLAILNQDEEAAPGNGCCVQFEPFISSQEGTYTITATLSSNGQVLDSVTFELVAIVFVPGGEILEITSWDEENEIWRPITDPIPEYEEITHRFRVNNTGSRATFKIGYCDWSSFQQRWVWSYSPSFDIEPGEGNIDWLVYTGGAGTFSVTFHLFSDDVEVDTMTVTIRVA